jgi:hypothetical protein
MQSLNEMLMIRIMAEEGMRLNPKLSSRKVWDAAKELFLRQEKDRKRTSEIVWSVIK